MELIIPMGNRKGETGRIIKKIDLLESRLRIQLKSFFPKLNKKNIIDFNYLDNNAYVIYLDDFPDKECQRLIKETLKDYKVYYQLKE